jgi:hypothetical protein
VHDALSVAIRRRSTVHDALSVEPSPRLATLRSDHEERRASRGEPSIGSALQGIRANSDAIASLRMTTQRVHADCNNFEFENYLIGAAALPCTSWIATDNGWHGLAIPLDYRVVYACLSASLSPCWAASAGNPSAPYGGRCVGALCPPANTRWSPVLQPRTVRRPHPARGRPFAISTRMPP